MGFKLHLDKLEYFYIRKSEESVTNNGWHTVRASKYKRAIYTVYYI